jgi:acyl-CoA synthetase (AMP-forming)/AMP-acid ligase II
VQDAQGPPRRVTYRDLEARSDAFAAFLESAGLRPGEVIHLLCADLLDTVCAFLGALRFGALPSIGNRPSIKVPPAVFLETFGEVLRCMGPAAVVCETRDAEMVEAALSMRPSDARPAVWTIDAAAAFVGARPGRRAHGDPGSVALLQHSSGTTGAKKGVVLSHRALVGHVYRYAQALDLRDGDSVASWLPLYHDMGLVACLILPLLTGTPVTLMSPFDWVLRPAMLLEAVDRDRSSLVWLPNFAFTLLAERMPEEACESLDLSSLRVVVNCSEPVTHSALQRFAERFGRCGLSRFALTTCYGMAENCFAVTQAGPEQPYLVDDVSRRSLVPGKHVELAPPGPRSVTLPSSGRPIDGTVVAILDPAGQELPERTVGQIAVAGASIADGYHGRPEDTHRAFVSGWYHTGDLGYRDGDHLFVLGRIDDVIIVAGQNIHAADIESVISGLAGAYPGRNVALGVRDDPRGTERLVVLVEVLLAVCDDPAGLERLREAVRDSVLGVFGVGVTDVLLLRPGVLHKTSSGKLARRRNLHGFRAGEFGPQELR